MVNSVVDAGADFAHELVELPVEAVMHLHRPVHEAPDILHFQPVVMRQAAQQHASAGGPAVHAKRLESLAHRTHLAFCRTMRLLTSVGHQAGRLLKQPASVKRGGR